MQKSATSFPPLAAPVPVEQRCHCGALLARVVGEMIEIKCKRCKSCTTFSFKELGLVSTSPSSGTDFT